MSNNDITQLSIQKLLSQDRHVIPMYQRNYAWEDGEIVQLIQDVIDCISKGNDYYIGTLVVYERKNANTYEVIDEQQRLTTLVLLAACLKNLNKVDCQEIKLDFPDKLNLHFDSRPKSQNTLKVLFDGRFKEQSDDLILDDINTEVLYGYRLIKRILPQKLAEHKEILQKFCTFLFQKVQIMRVAVPKDTDLNHYFEMGTD